MGVGAGLSMYVVFVQKFTFAISSPDEFLFYLLRLRRYKAKRVKTRSLQEWVGHFEPKFQGEGVVPGKYFWFLQNKTHFAIQRCKLHRATFHRFDTIPACDGRTDGQTDGIAVANIQRLQCEHCARCKNRDA